MGINEDLRSFINKYRVEKGKPFTNTSIGSPKVSLNIASENYDEFINLLTWFELSEDYYIGLQRYRD